MTIDLDVFLKIGLVKKCTGTSVSGIYAAIKRGEFPAPIKTGPRSVAWSAAAIKAWQEARINASHAAKAEQPMSDHTQHELRRVVVLVGEDGAERTETTPLGVVRREGQGKAVADAAFISRIEKRNATMIRKGLPLHERLTTLQCLFDRLAGDHYVDLRGGHER